MVLVKAGNHGFYQYRSGWFYFSLSGVNTVEAGYSGIPRSRNMDITCPAMQRPVFEGGGRWVRLSANGCQLHRPNTIPIFCAAVYRDYRLRTFIAIAFKLVYKEYCSCQRTIKMVLYNQWTAASEYFILRFIYFLWQCHSEQSTGIFLCLRNHFCAN